MKTKPTAQISRRAFVRQACCAAVGTTGLISALTQLRAIGAVAADRTTAAAIPADYKALVCLFLQGGNDATNLIVPFDAASHADYARVRADLAVGRSGLLALAPGSYADGRTYGLHPAVPELHGLFGQGRLAVLANVGTLVRPTTLEDFQAGRNLPPQLFSHSDQSLQWQSSIADQPFETGWGGRLADLSDALNHNNQISMSVSLNGNNSFQRGRTVGQFTINAFGASGLQVGSGSPALTSARYTGLKSVMGAAHANGLGAAFSTISKKAIEDSELINSVLGAAPRPQTAFPGSETGNRLAMVARMISVAPTLGLRRQVFFVQLGGWDLHGGQAAGHGLLLAELSGALKAFYDATVELGVASQVTTFTASDFGRTYVPNAGGTDHGWGNHQLIMGGAVRGGDIYGAMPSLVVGGPDDTGRGRWLPTTSVDEYNATLATWFGVSPANLSTVLPNIGRFARTNLGFMV